MIYLDIFIQLGFPKNEQECAFVWQYLVLFFLCILGSSTSGPAKATTSFLQICYFKFLDGSIEEHLLETEDFG